MPGERPAHDAQIICIGSISVIASELPGAVKLNFQLAAGAHFPSRADFSSRVSLLFHVLLLKPSSLGKGLVFPTLIFPPFFRNS